MSDLSMARVEALDALRRARELFSNYASMMSRMGASVGELTRTFTRYAMNMQSAIERASATGIQRSIEDLESMEEVIEAAADADPGDGNSAQQVAAYKAGERFVRAVSGTLRNAVFKLVPDSDSDHEFDD